MWVYGFHLNIIINTLFCSVYNNIKIMAAFYQNEYVTKLFSVIHDVSYFLGAAKLFFFSTTPRIYSRILEFFFKK